MTNKRWSWSVAVLATLFSPISYAETSVSVESFTLANGLEVIVVPNHRLPVVSHMLWYKVGAADDPPGKSGLAHYHEHMMFLGTAAHPVGEYDAKITMHGGQHNAFTMHDATAYYITISKDELPLAMALESDRMRPLTFSSAEAEREREVILEERRQRIENSPEALLREQMNAALFRHHPYHTPVIGWMSEMKQLTKADVLQFHQAWHYPNNAILVLSGDITAAEARPLAERYYGKLRRGVVPERRWNEEPPQNTARQVVMRHANVKQPQWGRIYAAPSLSYGDKAQALPLLLLSQLLGESNGSRLRQTLVADKKIASAVDTGYDAFTLGPSAFQITVTPADGVNMETTALAVESVIKEVLKNGFSEQEISRAKTQLKASSVYARDGLEDMARIMGWIRINGLDKEYFVKWPELIDAVTSSDIVMAAQDTLNMSQSVTGWLLPEAGEKK